jgi:AraC-like DNA-binding protein
MEKIPWHEKMPFKITFPFIAWDNDNATFPPHWHDFFEILFIKTGGLYLSIDDTVYEAESGDLIMVNSGTIHSFFDVKPKTSVLGLQFAITFFDESFIDLRDIVFSNPVISRSMMSDTLYEQVCRLLPEIFLEYHKRASGYQLAIKSKLYALTLALLRGGVNGQRHKPKATKSKQITDFILKNFDNPDLILEEAAVALNLNKFYFARFFKKHMGYSFHSYLTITRINFAKRYLLETKMSITDVAFRSGFGSLQTFNRVFKTSTGYTPGTYRRENKAVVPDA